jgi:hypothetical protein
MLDTNSKMVTVLILLVPIYLSAQPSRTRQRWNISEVTATSYVIQMPVTDTFRGVQATLYYLETVPLPVPAL